MDITKTRAELIREAAERLGIVGTGQPLEFEYSDRLDKNIDPLFLQLASDGICTVVNDNYIPAEWFDSLVGLLANISSQVGGKNFDPNIKEYYQLQLKRLTSSRPSYAIQSADYF